MASKGAGSITFSLKDETNGLKTLTVGATDLRKVMSATVSETDVGKMQQMSNRIGDPKENLRGDRITFSMQTNHYYTLLFS